MIRKDIFVCRRNHFVYAMAANDFADLPDHMFVDKESAKIFECSICYSVFDNPQYRLNINIFWQWVIYKNIDASKIKVFVRFISPFRNIISHKISEARVANADLSPFVKVT